MASVREAARPLANVLWRRLNRLTSLIPPPPFGGRPGVRKKVFLVCANPIGGSFSNAIADSAVRGLQASGHEIRRISLYDMPAEASIGLEARRGEYSRLFAPLLSMDEREGYFEENNQPQLKRDPHVQYAIESLRWCDSLVLVYPTWWFNIPAILKGFFDRCFVPGVGFRYNKETGKRETGLQNIQQVGILTTYGFSKAQVSISGDAGRRMISGGMRMLFAKDCTLQHMGMYEMQSPLVTHEHRVEFLDSVQDSFEKW